MLWGLFHLYRNPFNPFEQTPRRPGMLQAWRRAKEIVVMAKNVADVAAETGRRTSPPRGSKGLRFNRHFTPPGSHAHDLVEWERRTAAIIGEKGKVVFRQKDVEVPRSWSQLAINIVAQQYFPGQQGTAERETSVRQMVDRVVGALGGWGREGGYFAP